MTSFTQPGGTACRAKGRRRARVEVTQSTSGIRYPENTGLTLLTFLYMNIACLSLHFLSKVTKATDHLLKSSFSCNSALGSWQCLHRRCCDVCGGDRGRKIHIWTPAARRWRHPASHTSVPLWFVTLLLQKHRRSAEREKGKQDTGRKYKCVRMYVFVCETERAISSLIALTKAWFMDAIQSCCSSL